LILLLAFDFLMRWRLLRTIMGGSPGAAGPQGDRELAGLVAEPVEVLRPCVTAGPFVFASPHSGRIYCEAFVRASRLDALSLRKSEDAFVDELFACAPAWGAPLIAARFPRAFVDPNRGPGEIDAAMFEGPLSVPVGGRSPRVIAGLGVIPRVVRDGLEIYRARLPAGEAAFRLDRFYRPYHAALEALIAEAKAAYGIAILVDCHSMPPPSRATDVVIGDCYGESASAELTQTVQRALVELGFTVTRNAPYAGGYTTTLYGRPRQGVHAIQIEISRSLYLDEARIDKTEAFADCRARLGRFVERLTAAAERFLPRDGVRPMAAQ
jgi:N-formylglutamate amidohydrolase